MSGEKYQIRRLNFFIARSAISSLGLFLFLMFVFTLALRIFIYVLLGMLFISNLLAHIVFFFLLSYLLCSLSPSLWLINSHSLVHLLLLQCPSLMRCLQFTLLSCFICSHSFTFPFHYFISTFWLSPLQPHAFCCFCLLTLASALPLYVCSDSHSSHSHFPVLLHWLSVSGLCVASINLGSDPLMPASLWTDPVVSCQPPNRPVN